MDESVLNHLMASNKSLEHSIDQSHLQICGHKLVEPATSKTHKIDPNRLAARMNDSDRNLLAEAQRYEEEGEVIYNNRSNTSSQNDECARKYQKSLALRESVHGRYHSLTARSYRMIGKAFHKAGDPRAIVAYRTRHRINTFLYGKCNGPIDRLFQEVLRSRGLDENAIEEIGQEIGRSVRYEMEGDTLRRTGSRKAAGNEYHKAAKVEEYSFGKSLCLS